MPYTQLKLSITPSSILPRRGEGSKNEMLMQLVRTISFLIAMGFVPITPDAFAQDLAKAKQEGRIVFYTSWGPTDADYVVKAFEKKYPPLKVETVRSSSERTLTRLLSEHRTNTFLGDIVTISGIQSGILKEKGSLDRYQSSESVNFPADWRDPDSFAMGLHQTITSSAITRRLFPPTWRRRATRICFSLAGKVSSVGTWKNIISLARLSKPGAKTRE
jgi:ABC-type glycerol-3-phosphate transport system substrate-binding protein